MIVQCCVNNKAIEDIHVRWCGIWCHCTVLMLSTCLIAAYDDHLVKVLNLSREQSRLISMSQLFQVTNTVNTDADGIAVVRYLCSVELTSFS